VREPHFHTEHWQDAFDNAKDVGVVWVLGKNGHEARCVLQGHPMGIEARVLIDGDVQRTEAFRDSKVMLNATADWREAFEAKGWMPHDRTN
jgi:hypothetical protein